MDCTSNVIKEKAWVKKLFLPVNKDQFRLLIKSLFLLLVFLTLFLRLIKATFLFGKNGVSAVLNTISAVDKSHFLVGKNNSVSAVLDAISVVDKTYIKSISGSDESLGILCPVNWPYKVSKSI